ncbi:MAG TPA: DUF6049 family protein [Actinomycetota bacterium]|nr:DUF6049 family protein [Actinomycetota bacterium]
MRRLMGGVLAVSLFGPATFLATPPAFAQEPVSVAIQLLSQSNWNGRGRPLVVAIRATNTSDQVMDELSVVLSIHSPARSRSVYELSLRADATSLLSASLFAQRGALDPGQTRTFRLRQSLVELASRQEDAVYPLKVQLLSGDTPVGELRTPMIFLNERPRFPLHLAWTWVLSAPLQYRPDGTFVSTELEQEVGPAGRLSTLARALRKLRRTSVDVAVSPVLADQLAKMRSGYRVLGAGGTRVVPKGSGGAAAAANVLRTLGRVAQRRTTELIALPYGDAVVPAMLQAGLEAEVQAAVTQGRSVVESVLGARPQKSVFRPPLSLIDEAALSRLSALGVDTVLLDANAVPRSPDLMFTPPGVVSLPASTGELHAVVPDPRVMSLAQQYASDPALAAHAALGDLAATWLEFPGRPRRGAAVVFPERATLDPKFLRIFAGMAASSPWLRPVPASRFASLVEGGETTSVPAPRLQPPDPGYLARFLDVQRSLDRFETAAGGARRLIDQLDDRLLLAAAISSAGSTGFGLQFVDSVEAAIRRTYSGVEVNEGVVTLTSREGFIPVTLRNNSGVPLRVRVKLIADLSVAFVTGNSRQIVLPPSERTLTFAVRAKTTGRFPVRVQVRTPGPDATAETITQSEVVVRSTVYNRLALFLTIGAGLFLLLWWGRRFLPRARS